MTQGTTSERLFSIALLAGLVASVLAGIIARILMRIVALTAHMTPGFTLAGTSRILFIGFFVGFLPGFVYAFCILFLSNAPKVSKHLPGPMWRGLTFGLLLVVIVGLPSVLLPSPLLPQEDLKLGIPLLNKIMFSTLPLLYGLILGGTEKVFDHYLPRTPTAAKTYEKSEGKPEG